MSLDTDMVAVPRSLLAAAAYCVRNHAGVDSNTYRALSEASLSDAVTFDSAVAYEERILAAEMDAIRARREAAAAPDLLAACEFQENILSMNGDPQDLIVQVREMRCAAIAKARGEATLSQSEQMGEEG